MALFDPNSVRKKYENLVLIGINERSRVVLSTGKSYTERWARVRCSCGNELNILMSRWRSNPPSKCLKCSIRRSKKSGWHGFRARKKVQVRNEIQQ